ncbi:cytochrome D1 domain-containing protein [Kistimonas asteriae]|uniref:cytochrome D1 domain-containing protein n=1 Tax=Kistimonas asteriae TaxID=517724 RepID=UPI002484C783|nr:cytochrome D1 domain-containing protein [Kistimonas asteriae]
MMFRHCTAIVVSLLLGGCTTFSLNAIIPRATGDLGVVIERASGSVQLVDTSDQRAFASVSGLGDLSHASVVFSRDERFAYVFGRDGGLTKLDLLTSAIDRRVIQSGNSIGGAISQDGRRVAVSNYTPGGVRVFDSDTLDLVADIPATQLSAIDEKTGKPKQARVVGLVDAPGNRFVFSLFDSNEIWIADFSDRSTDQPVITRFEDIGRQPYDALITPDGRYYIAGLFGEDGMALLDLWHPEQGVRRILPDYGRGQQKLPVYKMPHLEGWAIAGNRAFIPAVGRHSVLVMNIDSWEQVAEIPVQGQPVFVMARPDGRQVWVNFAFPKNNSVQVIDTESLAINQTLSPGKAVLHMEFTPRGEQVWVSVRDDGKIHIYDTDTLQLDKVLSAESPSGIFFTARAHRIGL